MTWIEQHKNIGKRIKGRKKIGKIETYVQCLLASSAIQVGVELRPVTSLRAPNDSCLVNPEIND